MQFACLHMFAVRQVPQPLSLFLMRDASRLVRHGFILCNDRDVSLAGPLSVALTHLMRSSIHTPLYLSYYTIRYYNIIQ
jgi:hypothetical protein